MGLEGGFSFCGVDINSLKLQYVPELSSTYSPIGSAGFNVSSLSNGTMDGGLFYGTTVKQKEFTLRCIFELMNGDIRDGTITRIEDLFRRGRTGRLVFKQREYMWYTATVTDPVDMSRITNYMNGFLTIKLTAFYPYGRSTGLYFDNSALDNLAIRKDDYPFAVNNAGYVDKNRMPSNMGQAFDGDTLRLLFYNPGTEIAKTAIKIDGDLTGGVAITNETTGQKCEASGVNTNTKLLVIDGLNGKTALCDTSTFVSEPAFLYHMGGFIDMAPYGGIERDVELLKTDDRQFTLTNTEDHFDESYIGKWILARGATMKIINVDDNGALITDRNDSLETSSYITCDIVDCVNEVTVTKKPGTDIATFDIEYRPTFR